LRLRPQGQENSSLKVTAVQELSGDDYSDGAYISGDSQEEESPLTELQIAFDETYSAKKELDRQLRETPSMGFVDPLDVQRVALKQRKGRIKVWNKGEGCATTVDMAASVIESQSHLSSQVCREQRNERDLIGSGLRTWPVDLSLRKKLMSSSRNLQPFVEDVVEDPRTLVEPLLPLLQEAACSAVDDKQQRETSSDGSSATEEIPRASCSFLDTTSQVCAALSGNESHSERPAFRKISRTRNKKNRRKSDKVLLTVEWKDPMWCLKEAARVFGVYNRDGIHYPPSELNKRRDKSDTTPDVHDSKTENLELKTRMSTVLEDLAELTGGEPEAEYLRPSSAVQPELSEAEKDPMTKPPPGVPSNVSQRNKQHRKTSAVRRVKHQLDSRYTNDGNRRSETLLKAKGSGMSTDLHITSAQDRDDARQHFREGNATRHDKGGLHS
jgi:hypothetical protein